MMQHLTNDPSFWVAFWALLGMLFTALATLLGLLIAWAKAKTAEIEARDAKAGLVVTAKSLDRVEQAAGNVAAQVSTHSAQIAALQAQGSSAPAPAAASPSLERLDSAAAAQTAAQLVALTAQQAAAQIAGQAHSPTPSQGQLTELGLQAQRSSASAEGRRASGASDALLAPAQEQGPSSGSAPSV